MLSSNFPQAQREYKSRGPQSDCMKLKLGLVFQHFAGCAPINLADDPSMRSRTSKNVKNGLEFGNGLLIVDCITKQAWADTECKRVSKRQLQEPQLILFPVLEYTQLQCASREGGGLIFCFCFKMQSQQCTGVLHTDSFSLVVS